MDKENFNNKMFFDELEYETLTKLSNYYINCLNKEKNNLVKCNENEFLKIQAKAQVFEDILKLINLSLNKYKK